MVLRYVEITDVRTFFLSFSLFSILFRWVDFRFVIGGFCVKRWFRRVRLSELRFFILGLLFIKVR